MREEEEEKALPPIEAVKVELAFFAQVRAASNGATPISMRSSSSCKTPTV